MFSNSSLRYFSDWFLFLRIKFSVLFVGAGKIFFLLYHFLCALTILVTLYFWNVPLFLFRPNYSVIIDLEIICII